MTDEIIDGDPCRCGTRHCQEHARPRFVAELLKTVSGQETILCSNAVVQKLCTTIKDMEQVITAYAQAELCSDGREVEGD